MRQNLFLLLAFALVLSSCSSNISKNITRKYAALDRFAEVKVIPLEGAAPDGAEQIGTVFVDDSGSSANCSWDNLIEKIKREARKAGGNTIKISSHTPPGTAGSACHQITAQIFKTLPGVPNRGVQPGTVTTTAGNTVLTPADTVEEVYTAFRLAAHGGYSYRIFSTPDNITGIAKNYIDGLKSGFHFGGDATYFLSEKYGGGLKFSHSISSNSLDGLYRDNPDGSRTEGEISDNIAITFFGPSFTERYISSNRLNAFVSSIGVGYINYINNGVAFDQNVKFTGNTFGLTGEFGYEFGVSDELSVGLQLSYLIGKITTMQVDYGTRKETLTASGDSGESLNRFDLSIGLRFNK